MRWQRRRTNVFAQGIAGGEGYGEVVADGFFWDGAWGGRGEFAGSHASAHTTCEDKSLWASGVCETEKGHGACED